MGGAKFSEIDMFHKISKKILETCLLYGGVPILSEFDEFSTPPLFWGWGNPSKAD